MVTAREVAHLKNLRLFRWNHRLFKNRVAESEGLFLFLITKEFTAIHPREGVQRREGLLPKVVKFDLTRLLSPHDELLGQRVVFESYRFLSDTIKSLGNRISEYLFSRFSFCRDTLLGPNSPKPVIIVEIHQTRTVHYADTDLNFSDAMSMFFYPPIPTAAELRAAPNFEDIPDELLDIFLKTDFDLDGYIDPWWGYDDEIFSYLGFLGLFLGEGNSWPTRPITRDEPSGFVEVQPLSLPPKDFSGGAGDVKEDICAICLDGFAMTVATQFTTTSCLHVFHTSCLSHWLSMNNSCPKCRLPMPLT